MEEATTASPQKESTRNNIVMEEIRKKLQQAKFFIFSAVAVLLVLVFLILIIVLFIQDFHLSQENRNLQQKLIAEHNTKKGYMDCVKYCYNGRCITAENNFFCLCNTGYTGNNCTKRKSPTTDPCRSAKISGIFLMEFNGSLIEVYCEVEPDQKNRWLVFQRRMDGSENFFRNWSDYQHGFGSKNGEFWQGLDFLHATTKSQSYQLRVDLEDWNGNTIYAVYKIFEIGNSESNYTLKVGDFSGTANDSLKYHNNLEFTTKDRDNDIFGGNCAVNFTGAWWYKTCYRSNLNGKYFKDGQIKQNGIVWFEWTVQYYSLKAVKMKIRPNVNN